MFHNYHSIQKRLTCNPRTAFMGAKNCSLGHPECETKMSAKYFEMGYMKMHFLMAIPCIIF